MDSVDREGRGGIRMNGMVLVSLLFHAAILSLLFFSPSFPSPKLTFGPVYTVSLVSFSGKMTEQKSLSAAAKELMATDSARPATVLKKSIEPAQAVPIHSLEVRKKAADPNLEKAMEEIRKKAKAANAGSAVKQPKTTAAPEKQTGLEKQAGQASQTGPASQPGDGELNSKMNAYYAMIWSRIKGKWALPQGILSGNVLETVIDVTILRNGAVTGMNFEKRSGNRYFDESAVKAVQKAAPFPPLPAWIGENSLAVGIRFHSSELRP
jgi:colicin import membrane protein